MDVTNDEGSVFAGVILPRNETCDDLHVVIKLFNGYNVGVAAHRIVRAVETGYRKAVYKIPEKDFPFDPAQEERDAARHRRARSRAGSTTGPAPSSRRSRRASCTAPCRNWRTSRT